VSSRTACGLAAIFAASLVVFGVGASGSTRGVRAPSKAIASAAIRQARRLAREDGSAVSSAAQFSTRREARRVAAILARRIPLPQGGNFNGVRWEASEGALSAGQIDAILQYNAACQWLRALRDQREPPVARGVLATVGWWPAFRPRSAESAQLRATFAQALTGGGADFTSMLADCDGAHRREVSYALQRGLPASS
jgi:hypothetical protein